MGNGWTDPFIQYDASELAHGLGMIDHGQLQAQKKKEKRCQALLEKHVYNTAECFQLLDDVTDAVGTLGRKLNYYDVREYVTGSVMTNFPHGKQLLASFLQTKTVKDAAHASQSPLHWEECADPPYLALSHQDGLGVTEELSYVLNAGVRTL